MSLPLPIVLTALAAFAAIVVVNLVLFLRQRRLTRIAMVSQEAASRLTALNAAFGTAWLVRPSEGEGWRPSQTLEDWLGKSGSDAVAALITLAPEMQTLASQGEPFEKTVDVENRWLRLQGRMVELRQGPLPYVRVTDVSAEVSDRQKLLDDRQGLRSMVDETSQILTLLPIPIWRRDGDGCMAWANQAYLDAVGARSVADVVDEQIELTAGAMVETLRNEAVEVLSTRRSKREKHFVVIGDQRRAVQVSTLPLLRSNGTLSFALDTTESEELSTEINRITEAHKETLNTMASAVAIFAADKTLYYFNQAFAQLWRLPEDWLDSHPHHGDLLDAMREHRHLPEQVNFKSWKDDRLSQYKNIIEPEEEYWHLPDGRTLRVVTHPHPLGGILQLFEDVTDRLAMERSFNTLIAVQRETLNKLHEGVAVFSSDGLLRLFNPAYAGLWNIDAQQLEGGPHVSRIVDLGAPLFENEEDMRELQAIVIGGHEHREVRRGRLQRTDGTVVDYTAVPLPDGGTLLTYLDVTDRLQIERALIERNEALEAADRLKSEFVAHVSYELRTPINSILGFSEILEAEHFGALNEKQKEYVADIARSSKSLRSLINDILDLSMIEAGAMTIQTETVNIRDMLEEVVRIAAGDLEDKDLTCTVSCPKNVGTLEGDRMRLVQIIYNLVTNAVKYTPSGGRITVGARRAKDMVQLYVKDTGIGISEDEQEQVFTKFHTGSHDVLKGAGLGLSLVRRFVEMHNGEVVLQSELGKGTCVTCSLPRKQAAPAEDPRQWTEKGQSEQAPASTLH